MRAALGLDVGTTSVKAIALSEDGRRVGQGSSRPLTMRSPEAGWAVQSSAELRQAIVECLGTTVSSLPEEFDIVSLAAAVQSGSLVTVASDGEPSEDFITWMDTRSTDLVDSWLRDGTSTTIREVSGWTVHPGQALSNAAWLRTHRPAEWAEVSRIASVDDMVVHWLTGRWATNPSNAAGTAMIDLATGQWNPSLTRLAGLEPKQLSDLVPSGTPIGQLSPRMAGELTMSDDVLVISGGHDQACTALALGVSEPGRALLAGGTAWVLTTVVAPSATTEVGPEMNVSFHVVPELRTASSYLGGMGACMEWWLEQMLGRGETRDVLDRFAVLDRSLAGVATTRTSPYFYPVRDRSATRPGAGVFLNERANTSDGDRARSIMEYAAFKVRTAIESLAADQRPTSLTMVGGATQSPGWANLVADVTGLMVAETAEQSLPALGAAALAGVGAGLYVDLNSAIKSFRTSHQARHPNPSSAELYRFRYQAHLEQEAQQ